MIKFLSRENKKKARTNLSRWKKVTKNKKIKIHIFLFDVFRDLVSMKQTTIDSLRYLCSF